MGDDQLVTSQFPDGRSPDRTFARHFWPALKLV